MGEKTHPLQDSLGLPGPYLPMLVFVFVTCDHPPPPNPGICGKEQLSNINIHQKHSSEGCIWNPALKQATWH